MNSKPSFSFMLPLSKNQELLEKKLIQQTVYVHCYSTQHEKNQTSNLWIFRGTYFHQVKCALQRLTQSLFSDTYQNKSKTQRERERVSSLRKISRRFLPLLLRITESSALIDGWSSVTSCVWSVVTSLRTLFDSACSHKCAAWVEAVTEILHNTRT